MDNPQAFPCTGEGYQSDLYTQKGMTLRDWFAGQVIPAVIAATSAGQHQLIGVGTVHDMIAQDAYRLADAMLAERTKAQPDG